MDIKVERIRVVNNTITAAFYYAIAPGLQLPGANDQTRQPAGDRLTSDQKQDLKDGSLHEYMFVRDVEGMNDEQVRDMLENAYHTKRKTATDDYQSKYSADGDAWDGVNWS